MSLFWINLMHWKAPLHFIPSSTNVNSSKVYKITIVVACTCITVAPIFAHHPISLWTSVNNHISCTTYLVSSATYHQNYCYNGSTTFKLMSYERSIGEIQDQQVVTRYSHSTDCYVAKQYTTTSRVSYIPCIGCNISNMCHMAIVTGAT